MYVTNRTRGARAAAAAAAVEQLSSDGSPGPSLAEIWLAIVGVGRGLSSGGKWTLAKRNAQGKTTRQRKHFKA